MEILALLCLGVVVLGVLAAVVPVLLGLIEDVQTGELDPITWIIVGVVLGVLCLCAGLLLE
ncbi:hypothetical protein [Catellatospora sichuanensis]|uniref:hypothetical protein n=1 Tax=Catellatospora sichuanensis TaxID=1969805 RepID=UPI001181F314|nr:hypothetical protein [Catellatospora sichuanensis]